MVQIHEVCASLLVALRLEPTPDSVTARSNSIFDEPVRTIVSFQSLQNSGQKVRPVGQQSVHNMQTRHSHQLENCNSGNMFGKSS
jgi:hypothetical protein